MTKTKELSLIDTAEAARRLDVTPARISQLVSAGTLTPAGRVHGGRAMLFHAADVEKLKQARIQALLKQAEDLRST